MGGAATYGSAGFTLSIQTHEQGNISIAICRDVDYINAKQCAAEVKMVGSGRAKIVRLHIMDAMYRSQAASSMLQDKLPASCDG
jgi:hypothetical protein